MVVVHDRGGEAIGFDRDLGAAPYVEIIEMGHQPLWSVNEVPEWGLCRQRRIAIDVDRVRDVQESNKCLYRKFFGIYLINTRNVAEASSRSCALTPSTHCRHDKIGAAMNTCGPARGYGLEPRIEPHAFGAVHVVVPEQRGFPAAE
jgi:hypothetical protein